MVVALTYLTLEKRTLRYEMQAQRVRPLHQREIEVLTQKKGESLMGLLLRYA